MGWEHELREMQVTAALAQVDGDDVLVHAATGMGKTAIVAAPHAFPQNKGRVTLFISPLIALQEEMVETFRAEFNLAAVAVNSTRKGPLKTTFQDICAGKYAVVLLSPEMLQTRQFIDLVLRNHEFSLRFLSLAIDEAHTVSHWGAHFRKKYATLGVMRAFLPPGTSVVALSASLTPRVRADVLRKLRFGTKFVDIDLGNNRPNVSIVVRACHRLLSSFADLDFVIPRNVQAAGDIPATFVYADNKDEGAAIVDHLRELLPEGMRNLGLVRPFNASLSHDYRRNALLHFKAGTIRVLVCTDAAGMGCNLPNIEVVVQWKLPKKLSMFVQRAGRAARRPGMAGLAVLLVEPTAYTQVPDINDQLATTPSGAGRVAAEQGVAGASSGPRPAAARGKKLKVPRSKPRAPKGWSKAHGRHRGATAGDTASNAIDRAIVLLVNQDAEDEGLITLVQTGDCRRRVQADAFNSHDQTSTVPCCDLCDPTLLERTLPGPGAKRKAAKKKQDKEKQPAQDVVDALRTWRLKIWEEDFTAQFFNECALLPDALINVISLVPEVESERALRGMLDKEWLFCGRYSKSLWHALVYAYNARPPPAPQPVKRKHAISAPQAAEDAGGDSQRAEPAAAASRSEPRTEAVPASTTTTTSSTPAVHDAASAHTAASASRPAKRRKTTGAVQSGSATAPAQAGATTHRAPPPLPAAGPVPAGYTLLQPQPVVLHDGQVLPSALAHLQPPPAPSGRSLCEESVKERLLWPSSYPNARDLVPADLRALEKPARLDPTDSEKVTFKSVHRNRPAQLLPFDHDSGRVRQRMLRSAVCVSAAVPHTDCGRPEQDRVKASQVSRTWRATLLGNATFWTTIHKVHQLFSQALPRIRCLVLNYSDLHVLWPHDAPVLESLALDTPVPPGIIDLPYFWILDCAPQLKSLSMGHFVLPTEFGPLRNITAFSGNLGSSGPLGARRIFDLFPCLASLTLNEVDNLDQLPQSVLPSVEEIVLVSNNAMDFSPLLRAWATPPNRGTRCFEIGVHGPQILSAALEHLATAQPATAPSIAVDFDGSHRIVLSTSAPYDLKIVLRSTYARAFSCAVQLPVNPYLGMIQSLRLSGMMLTSVLRTKVEFPSVRNLAIGDEAIFDVSSIRMAIRRNEPALRVPRLQDLVFDFSWIGPRSGFYMGSQRTVSQIADFVGSHIHRTEGSLASITIIDSLLPQWEDVSGLLAYTPRIYHCYGSCDSPQEMAGPGRS
ncbi:P-loop containing nucleoside triphosphate hydrolase protein [Auricularia subglabra TFB-10046 SS5]|nr:P-loop containing nucleoside triphosphate hydrolase protein [Auricularia subglabra TFB-10046 SS5]